MTIIVPIGIDCGIANFCNKYRLRTISLPFDWIVSYSGVFDCINDKFDKFIPDYTKINKYNMVFPHHFSDFELDKSKFIKRIERFENIIKTCTEKIYFIRKGHDYHNHPENAHIKNDIEDAIQLSEFFKKNYPYLNFTIYILLICDTCFDPKINYTSSDSSIEIYNIATPLADDNKFEETVKQLLNLN